MTLKGARQPTDIQPDRCNYDQLKAPFPPFTPPDPGTPGSFFQHNPFPMPDLLTVRDIMGICQLSRKEATRLIHAELPDYAVVAFRKKLRVHSWAMAHFLKMADRCPGCGQPWRLSEDRARRAAERAAAQSA